MPDMIERRQVRMIASFSNEDARVGLEIMRRAALLAEDERKERIEDEHVKRAWEQAKFLRIGCWRSSTNTRSSSTDSWRTMEK